MSFQPKRGGGEEEPRTEGRSYSASGRNSGTGMKRERNPFPSAHSLRNRVARALWGLVWLLLFRPSPRVLHGWRRMLLRLFGARIDFGVHIDPSVKIWAPWNLEMAEHSCMELHVDCYSADPIFLGAFCTVSQYSYLCAATHDYTDPRMPLIARPIRLGPRSWTAADVFIAAGVSVGEGAVIGARSSVFRNVESWAVVAGNPARFIKRRRFQGESGPEIAQKGIPQQ